MRVEERACARSCCACACACRWCAVARVHRVRVSASHPARRGEGIRSRGLARAVRAQGLELQDKAQRGSQRLWEVRRPHFLPFDALHVPMLHETKASGGLM